MPKTFIIAEMSANHAHDINIAKEIIKAAKNSGSDAIKIQTYTADTMTIDCDAEYFMGMKGSPWENMKSYDLYRDASMPWDWQPELKAFADEIKIELFSTVFDKTSVEFLEKMNLSKYKIASFEAIDYPLIEYTAKTGKPIIISTGITTLEEIQEIIDICKTAGNNDITIMKCTSAYPASLDKMNILTIKDMVERFSPQGVKIGLSDHSMNNETVIAAVALGATVIEKHLTLDRNIKTADSVFSLNPDEFKQMVESVRNTEKLLGEVNYDYSPNSRMHARSIFVVKDIQEGEFFTEENIRIIRPSKGLHPKHFFNILGKKSSKTLKRGTPLKLEFVE